MDDPYSVRRVQDLEGRQRDGNHLVHGELAVVAARAFLDRLAVEQLHRDEDIPILRRPVIQHSRHARVIDALRDERLAMKAFAHVGHAGDRAMKDLERDLRAVPRRSLVDRARAAHAYEASDRVAAGDGRADALLRQRQVLVAIRVPLGLRRRCRFRDGAFHLCRRGRRGRLFGLEVWRAGILKSVPAQPIGHRSAEVAGARVTGAVALDLGDDGSALAEHLPCHALNPVRDLRRACGGHGRLERPREVERRLPSVLG